jgi:L-alanine-DL-glutamate epimerase-like enolase superfamily enzyme
MDVIAPMLSPATMGTFTFHGWLICEIFTNDGLVGIGEAALSPLVTKQVIDLYLKPLLIGADPWDLEFLWQHMYRKTMAFGRKGVAMVAISAVDIAQGLSTVAKQPVCHPSAAAPNHSRLRARLYTRRSRNSRAKR